MARRRAVVLGVWLLVLGACIALYPSLGKELSTPDYGVEGSQSRAVEQLLNGPRFASVGSEQDLIVFYSRDRRALDPAFRADVGRVLKVVRGWRGVGGVAGPYLPIAPRGAAPRTAAPRGVAPPGAASRGAVSRGVAPPGAPRGAPEISADGHAALAHLALAGGARVRFARAGRLQSAIARASKGDVHAWLTGFSSLAGDLARVQARDGERAEGIGIPVALLVLVVALGALSAAIVPLVLAGAGLLLTFGTIALLGRLLDFDAFLLTIVTMIGVGIGIDYSLFIVSRFREELARSPEDPRHEARRTARAVGAAIATSGRTIVYSGVIVALSLVSLLVVRAPVFREFVVGAMATVVCTLAAALTLLPALLAQLGGRINAGSLPARLQPANIRGGGGARGRFSWASWATAVMRRPVVFSLAVSLPLLAAMGPIAGIRYGLSLDLGSLKSTPSGKGATVLARSFSAGAMGPLQVALLPSASSSKARRDTATAVGSAATPTVEAGHWLEHELRRDRRVAAFVIRSHPPDALLTVTPAVPIDSAQAKALVLHIRKDLAPGARAGFGVAALVGGWPAQALDASSEVSGELPRVLAITLALALVFLLAVFRSLVLPLKAVAMNILATGATLGLVVLLFQDGHGEAALGFTSPGFIVSFLPLSMFVLLFGLSMDYEVFLIRRMQESWLRTRDNELAVAAGVEHTARPISCAAAIMVAVFGSFLTATNLELKQFGFALAAAIAIDATLIRLVLVPALMRLLGTRNWWLPARLEAILPRLRID